MLGTLILTPELIIKSNKECHQLPFVVMKAVVCTEMPEAISPQYPLKYSKRFALEYLLSFNLSSITTFIAI